MKRFTKLKEYFSRLLGKFAFIAPLITRVAIGEVFVRTGWGKLNNLDRVIGFFGHLGIPVPNLMAPVVSFFEFTCGLLLIVGLFTRLSAIPLAVIMKVALITTKKDEITSFADLFELSEFLYLALLGWLIFEGAGQLSVDHALNKFSRKRKAK